MPNFDPEQLLRQDLLNFPPYHTPPVTTRDFDRVIKMDANENAYPPSPRALAALADFHHWNRYATQDELRPDIARYVGVGAEHIVVGNGADELIDLVQRIFLERGDAMVNLPPTFEMYGKYAALNAVRMVEVPRRADFSIDVEAIERAISNFRHLHLRAVQVFQISDSGTPNLKSAICNLKLLFLANPNNPDGSITARADIERLLALPIMVVLDEAYAEFSGESFATRVQTQQNLIVLRTFSKWAGLAGLRIGYAIAPAPIADQLLRTKSPYNVNAAAIVAARASLEDVDFLMANVCRIIAERARLSAALTRLGFVRPLPSHTNFLLCRMVGRDANAVRDALAARGILVRTFSAPRLRDCILLSVGTPEQD